MKGLSDILKKLEKPVNLVIGNDEILSWQDGGDRRFDILNENLCDEKILIHRASPFEMRWINYKASINA